MKIDQILLFTILYFSSIVLSSPVPGNVGQLLGKAAGDIRCTTAACFQHAPVKLSQRVGKMFSNMGKSMKKSNSNFVESFKSTYSPLRENEIKFKLDQNEIKTKKTNKKVARTQKQLNKFEERLAELSSKKESLSGQSSSYQHSSNSIPRNSFDSVGDGSRSGRGSHNIAVRQTQPPAYDSIHRVSSGRISNHHSPADSGDFSGSPKYDRQPH